MANSHIDPDHQSNIKKMLEGALVSKETDLEGWMNSLETRARKIKDAGASRITNEGEVLGSWELNGFGIERLPEDEHRILRISIGGGPDTPISCDYLRFRGDIPKIRKLLTSALQAIQEIESMEKSSG